jgi:hypothetical protein
VATRGGGGSCRRQAIERTLRSPSEVTRDRAALSEFRWASAAASYTAPPLDGSRPGIFPGHHTQVAFGVENRALPTFRQVRARRHLRDQRRLGLYAERMVAQEGWYEGDPEGLLGQLDDELFRARRLVVDTGLHAMRWTRQQAIDYGIEPQRGRTLRRESRAGVLVQDRSARDVQIAGEGAHGARPAIQHQGIPRRRLSAGSVPLTVLERQVDIYIASKKAA